MAASDVDVLRNRLERISLDCRKTKTKLNTRTSQPKGVIKPKPKPIPFDSQVKTALRACINAILQELNSPNFDSDSHDSVPRGESL